MDRPFFYFKGRRFEAVVDDQSPFAHRFGGPCPLPVTDQPLGQKGVHHILTLDLTDPVLSGIGSGIGLLPVLYGFQYEEGLTEYDVAPSEAHITRLDTSSFSPFWPYEDYPSQFPVHSMRLTEPIPCSLEEFEQDVWQWIDRQFENHLIAIVPPSEEYGVGLWEEGSQFDHIHVKCFVHPSTLHCVVYNECD